MLTNVGGLTPNALGFLVIGEGSIETVKYQTGDIVLLDMGSERRFVCVLDYDPRLDVASVLLTGNEFDLLTDGDFVVTPEETGFRFPLVITSLVGPVKMADHVVVEQRGMSGDLVRGALSSPLTAELPAWSFGEAGPLIASRRGMPLRGPSDARWSFVERELALFSRIMAPWEDA